MKIFALFISVILLSQNPLWAQNYIWPTNSGRYLSSSFGEYRDGHFHSGIDIKTNYRTGYPVFAIADGYVWRVRTSPFGYGKAVYVKLDDGNMAVYGHLDEFNRFLNAYVKAEQLINKRYSTDIYFQENEYRVSRGDTIAYTGKTGTKHPHLHFEIRDKNNRLINPLNTNLKIIDPTIPTIKAVAIVPLNTRSRINGLPKIQIFRARWIHKRLFTISDTISITGPIGIEIKTHDTVRGVPNFYNAYGIRLRIDDSLFFHVQYDSFGFEETHLISIDRNFQLRKNGHGNFHRLWTSDVAENLRFYSRTPSNGKLTLEPGLHAVQIEVYDRYMNTSYLNFSIYTGDRFDPTLSSISSTDEQWLLQLTTDEPESTLVRLRRVNSRGVFQGPLLPDSLRRDSARIEIHLQKKAAPPGNVYKITCQNRFDRQTRSFFLNPRPSSQTLNDNPTVSFIQYPNSFLSQVDFDLVPNTIPELYRQTAENLVPVPVYAITPKTYISNALPLAELEHTQAFEWRYNHLPENIVRTPVRFVSAVPGKDLTFMAEDAVLSIHIPATALYDTLICWTGKETVQSSLEETFHSDLYTVYPLDRALKDDIRLEIKLPPGTEHTEQLGVYRLDDDEWRFSGNEVNADRTAMLANTDKLGSYLLMRDDEPPEIHSIVPGNGGRFRFGDIIFISAVVKDDLSGIDGDTSISVYLDEQPLYVEYNAPNDRIRYKVAGDLPTGQHTISITVVDRAKNSRSKSSVFTVY